MNRPGLSQLRYRAGTHGAFFESMLARLSSPDFPTLAGLTARTADDPAIALLDAWAVVADVLTFYDERIANEGYLRTATERRSILELGRLVGYALRPGVAATAYLAYTVDADPQSPDNDRRVTIPRGSRVQSTPDSAVLPRFDPTAAVDRPPGPPDPRTLPQTFETAEDLEARASWSILAPRRRQPIAAFDSRQIPDALDVVGIDHGIRRNTRVLFRFGELAYQVRTVAAATTDPILNLTSLQFVSIGAEAALDALVRKTLERLELARVEFEAIPNPKVVQLVEIVLVPPIDRLGSEIAAKTLANLATKASKQLRGRATTLKNAGLDDAADHAVSLALDLDMVATDVSAFDPGLLSSAGAVAGPRFGRRDTGRDPSVALGVLDGLLASSRIAPSTPPRNDRALGRSFGHQFQTGSDEAVQLLGALDRRLGRTLYSAWATATEAGGPSYPEVSAFRIRCQLFGAAAPLRNNSDNEPEEWFPLATGAPYVQDGQRTLPLDGEYDDIVAGSLVHIEFPDGLAFLASVEAVATVGIAAFGLSGRFTVLTLDVDWLSGIMAETGGEDFGFIRNAMIFADPRPLTLADEAITECVGGGEIALDLLHDGLTAGRWVIVAGERCDENGEPTGVSTAELAMLAGTRQEIDPDRPGDTVRTTLELANSLAYTYVRARCLIYGNVAKATHGETHEELLGSGDGAASRQAFELRAKPLTWLAAPIPLGVEPELEVRVDRLIWRHVDDFRALGPKDRGYRIVTDEEDRSTVVFGDGTHGARPTSGTMNIAATYRVGFSAAGGVDEGRITNLSTRPLGVNAVTNPLPATGGAGPESRDQARRNLPLGIVALDRLVSVSDFADFARARAGIGRASAALVSNGRRQLVQLTIAGVDDAPIDRTSDMYTMLVESLVQFGDPGVAFEVDVRELLLLQIAAKVRIDDDRRWVDLEPVIRAAIGARFSFESQDLARHVYLSEVQATIQGVRGVRSVDVDVLDAASEEAVAAAGADLTQLGVPQPPQPKRWVEARPGRFEGDLLRPAQLVLLSPAIPDTLILTELTS